MFSLFSVPAYADAVGTKVNILINKTNISSIETVFLNIFIIISSILNKRTLN
nr:MAG TPA: hypothetical protein [Caudoviricetes sp.]